MGVLIEFVQFNSGSSPDSSQRTSGELIGFLSYINNMQLYLFDIQNTK